MVDLRYSYTPKFFLLDGIHSSYQRYKDFSPSTLIKQSASHTAVPQLTLATLLSFLHGMSVWMKYFSTPQKLWLLLLRQALADLRVWSLCSLPQRTWLEWHLSLLNLYHYFHPLWCWMVGCSNKDYWVSKGSSKAAFHRRGGFQSQADKVLTYILIWKAIQ